MNNSELYQNGEFMMPCIINFRHNILHQEVTNKEAAAPQTANLHDSHYSDELSVPNIGDLSIKDNFDGQ